MIQKFWNLKLLKSLLGKFFELIIILYIFYIKKNLFNS